MEAVAPALFAACLETLRDRPAGLLTDVDGTLSHLAPTPDSAVVADEIRHALASLARELRVVAVISGRAAADARRLVGVDGLVYVGNHGLEELKDGQARWDPAAEPYRSALAAARQALASLPIEIPGAILEDKGPTISIHYRLAAAPPDARERILARLRPFLPTLRITEGKMVVEARPPVDVAKATAVTRLVEQFDLRGAIYLGDDRTDVGAFAALRGLRDSAKGRPIRALALSVAGPETPPEVLQAADAIVPGVDAVGALLRRLSDALEGGQG